MAYDYDYRPRGYSMDEAAGRESMRQQGFRMEDRPGGCDIRPPAPPPVLSRDDAVYEYITQSKDTPSLHGTQFDIPAEYRKMSLSGLISFLKWTLCVVILLWMFTVSSPFFANALTQSGWRFWCSVVLGSLPLVFVFCLAGYVWFHFRKMPRIEQINAVSYASRAELRRQLVDSYFSKFPKPEVYAAINEFPSGGTNRTRELVVETLDKLQHDNVDNASWFHEFERFQKQQDEQAKTIIWNAGKLVGAKTAISPWKIVDMIAVLYNSTIMIAKLARLYNRCISKQAAFRLVFRWIVNIYIAGELGDMAQGTSEWLTDFFAGALKPFAGIIGKLAEGGTNGAFVGRLGIRAVAEFRPLVGKMR